MTIASEINRIRSNIESAYTALTEKGALLPVTQNSANLANTIATLSFNDNANVITAINYTGSSLTKGSKVWISLKNPTTQVIDGYYIINFADITDDTCYTAITSDVCAPLESVDVFTVLDSNTMTAADNDDFTYEVIE